MANKTINLELAGLDGNAFFLLGAFSRQARREGWTDGEIKAVTDEAKSGDYDNLLRVLIRHCESVDEGDGYDEPYEDEYDDD
jgi:hypothetical protein